MRPEPNSSHECRAIMGNWSRLTIQPWNPHRERRPIAAYWPVCVTTQVFLAVRVSCYVLRPCHGLRRWVYQFETTFHKPDWSQAMPGGDRRHIFPGSDLSVAEVHGCCRICGFQMAAIPFVLAVFAISVRSNILKWIGFGGFYVTLFQDSPEKRVRRACAGSCCAVVAVIVECAG